MNWLQAALAEVAEQPGGETLDSFRQSINPEWIDEALKATGTATLRKRRLPAEQVVWLVLGMALMRDRPIEDVASKLDLAMPGHWNGKVAKSSVVEARKRLGSEPLKWLFQRCSREWALSSAADHAWRGLSLFATDGTTMRVPDSDDNHEVFGVASGGDRGHSAYPLARLVAVVAVRSHLVADASIGAYGTSEHTLADQCFSVVPDNSLTIVDKNFLAAKYLVGLRRSGVERHWLIRAKSSTKWKVIEEHRRGDLLVELTVSRQARQKDPSLPATYTARAIEYQFPDSKGPQWLLTSLLDVQAYPADELVGVYHERWEIEQAYDEIKTHLLEREEALRSRTSEGIYQELWGLLLTYNLVRLEMQNIAMEAKVPPTRISFMMAVRFVRDAWFLCSDASPGSIPGKLRKIRKRASEFVLPPRRRHRRYPRAVKIKMSSYPKLRKNPDRHPTSRESAKSDATVQ